MKFTEKIIAEFKSRPAIYILLIILLFFSFNGIKEYWQDFKHHVMVSELEQRGIILKEQEAIILQNQAGIDSNITIQEKKVVATDVQKYKNKNEQAKDIIRKQKGLVVTNNDIDAAMAEQLVTKWTTKK